MICETVSGVEWLALDLRLRFGRGLRLWRYGRVIQSGQEKTEYAIFPRRLKPLPCEDGALVTGDARIRDYAKMCERAETERLESAFFLAVEDLLFIETNLLKQPMRQVVVVLRRVGGGKPFSQASRRQGLRRAIHRKV